MMSACISAPEFNPTAPQEERDVTGSIAGLKI
jgi:hypothetical protein